MVAWVPRFDDFKSYSNIIRVAAEPETCQAKTAANSVRFLKPPSRSLATAEHHARIKRIELPVSTFRIVVFG